MNTKEILNQFNEDHHFSVDCVQQINNSDFYGIKCSDKIRRLISILSRKDITSAFQSAKIYIVPEFTDDENHESLEPYSINNLDLPNKCIYVLNKDYNANPNKVNGFIISKDIIITFVYMTMMGRKVTLPLLTYYKGEWMESENNSKWNTKLGSLVLKTIEDINSHHCIKTNGITDPSFFRVRDRIFKGYKVKPLDYYTVTVQSRVVSNADNSSIARTECNYAYDVRGHYVYRIMTGELPMDVKIEKYLKRDDRRKIFYSPNELDEESQRVLSERDITLVDGHWVSILKYWVDAYVANTKEGINPYIPSIHKLV